MRRLLFGVVLVWMMGCEALLSGTGQAEPQRTEVPWRCSDDLIVWAEPGWNLQREGKPCVPMTFSHARPARMESPAHAGCSAWLDVPGHRRRYRFDAIIGIVAETHGVSLLLWDGSQIGVPLNHEGVEQIYALHTQWVKCTEGQQ